MTLDEDTLKNVITKKDLREIGRGLIVHDRIQLLSNKAWFATPYFQSRLNPGLMVFFILIAHSKHKLVVYRNSELVFLCGDKSTFRLVSSHRTQGAGCSV